MNSESLEFFTKTLDITMINGQVDIAVHSMKDVPTALPGRLFKLQFWKSATLDILVSGNVDFLNQNYCYGSLTSGTMVK
jgi:hydroxymethylbilane synthase